MYNVEFEICGWLSNEHFTTESASENRSMFDKLMTYNLVLTF